MSWVPEDELLLMVLVLAPILPVRLLECSESAANQHQWVWQPQPLVDWTKAAERGKNSVFGYCVQSVPSVRLNRRRPLGLVVQNCHYSVGLVRDQDVR